MRVTVILLLFTSFLVLFMWLSSESLIRRMINRTFDSMDAAARVRVAQNRKLLQMLGERKGFSYRVEQRLLYSGLSIRFPILSLPLWIVINLGMSAVGYFAAFVITGDFAKSAAAALTVQIIRYFWEEILIGRNYRSVNDNLMTFLDFLGSYSLTSGEVTSVLNQVSKYVDEPLKSVLDACYYEAQLSGDTSLALLSMAEKIEHPQFKELVRNMEISVRYSADFSSFVSNSRRSVSEHFRTRQERRNMMGEALVNMLIIAGMSGIILITVEELTGISVRTMLLETLPGKLCVSSVMLILMVLYMQMRKLDD